MSQTAYLAVRDITAGILGLNPGAITAESSPENIDVWDSVQHLNLVLALEERFGLTLEPEEIEKMKNVGSIVAVLEGKLGPAA
jgi:acyl carrier protein